MNKQSFQRLDRNLFSPDAESSDILAGANMYVISVVLQRDFWLLDEVLANGLLEKQALMSICQIFGTYFKSSALSLFVPEVRHTG